ncbi:cell wall metabolism sensor histidine kinase WalK [uncultured Paenibacillus sp.]|uniref:sensor histidine kinase n=1 Tax=uncultured Paenibacillus sp. TaxID=227322 RepID=UPI0015B0ED0D|nr:HAMP domain-containing sensor histidine kinase [uncultured Paenibacillus sp.]
MMRGIVLKLFLLTTALCLFIVVLIFAGQTVFFKQFYMQQKVDEAITSVNAFEQEYLKTEGEPKAVGELEQEYDREHGIWIAALDESGNLLDSGDFAIEVRLNQADGAPGLSGQSLTIPLYTMADMDDFSADNPLNVFGGTWVLEGGPIAIEGLLMNDRFMPQRASNDVSGLREEDRLENAPLVHKEYEVVPRYPNPELYREKYPSVLVRGMITNLRLPEGDGVTRYANRLFLERIKAFQADLLYGDYDDENGEALDFTENDVNYKLIVKRIESVNGKPSYIFAMMSLQPVSEAAEVMQSYVGYMIIAALLLAVAASLYVSRRIARPLLRMNRTTRQIARLDFSEKLPVRSRDELGQLSGSINELSERLHSHIRQLERDIEKEKQLEHTRKEFIAGVSHELKTPLSVIQSCLAVLKDGVAGHKRDYYFAAMEEEVNGMILLIEDMLELAKYESGTYAMNTEPFEIVPVVERVCRKLAPDMDAKRLMLSTRLVNAEVVANRHRIEQVLVNFLTNAICYTPEGETLLVTTDDEGETLRVGVENRGVHLPEEQLEKVWDRFYRGEPSRNSATGGTGLGLAIAKNILELHGSSYGVTNTGEGVLFYFDLRKQA